MIGAGGLLRAYENPQNDLFALPTTQVPVKLDSATTMGFVGVCPAAAPIRAYDVTAVEADLASREGVDSLYQAIGGRRVSALLANAGRGLGHAFLDQDFARARHVIDTNITGTVYLIHKVGNDMRRRDAGRILITGSIAGFIPGSFQAV